MNTTEIVEGPFLQNSLPSASVAQGPVAALSCHFCRKRKRACDRRSPECSFCIRHKRRCLYPAPRAVSLADEETEPAASRSQQRARSDVVSVHFLDQEIFIRGQMTIPQMDSAIPSDVSKLIGDGAAIRIVTAEYFQTVHLWWPIVSRTSFYSQILNPLLPRRSDAALLLLALRLIVWRPSDDDPDPRTILYTTAKRYYVELESEGCFSLCALQAGILIALYEFGHSIYPSALSTIASCARYGRALDIDLSPRRPESSPSLFESEQRRRVWWAIVILDRFANIPCPGRRFETHDPEPGDLLPVSDAAWDAGVVTPADEMTIANPNADQMGRFAKFAQATHLLCRVLQTVNGPSTDDAFREEQKLQLEKTIFATIRMISGPVAGPKGAHAMICFSSLFVLYEHDFEVVPSTALEVSRHEHARAVLEQGAQTSAMAAFHFLEGRVLPPEQVAALVLHWQYKAAKFYLRMKAERANEEDTVNLENLKATLKVLDTRWKVAGTYLRMLEARDMMQM